MLEERAATWPRQWMAEGFEKGHVKGHAAGHAKGRAAGHVEGHVEGHESGLREALMSLAAEKFGSLGGHQAELIDDASEAQLRLWLKRILSAEAAVELFGS